MDPEYLPFCANPTKPSFRAPLGAVDAHCHVFGPVTKFPYAKERKYTPCDAPKDKLFALRDLLGFARNVIVQGSCHGKDNRAMLDALKTANGKARGVAVVETDITAAALKKLHDGGVRAVRFNFVRRLVDVPPLEDLLRVGKLVADLGWHIVVYFEAKDLAELTPFFKYLPTTVVVDHMGRPDVTKGTDDAQFQAFVRLLREDEKFWTKVNGEERITVKGPPYDDVVPFSRLLVEEFSERVLWGTDWPHPNMKSHMPDDGLLVDSIPKFATTPELQFQLLIDNPLRLYWSD